MKTSPVFYYVLFILSIWLPPANSQQVSDYVIKYNDSTNSNKAKGPHFHLLNTADTHSRKKEIKMATGLMIFSVVSTGASLPFFLYYGVSSQPWGGSSFWGSSNNRDVSKTPLYIGGGLFFIGAIASVQSIVLFFKNPDSDRNLFQNKKMENVSMQMTIHPGKAVLYVHF